MSKGKNIGYVRVSTIEQNEERQLEALKPYFIEKVFLEKTSGKSIDRPRLQELFEFVREGDNIYIESFSRLARDTRDLLNLLEVFSGKGVGVISLKENINTTSASGKLMVTLIGAVVTFERDIMLERQRGEGIALAKAQGKYKGRVPKVLPEDFDRIYKQYMSREITKSKMAELCSVSRPVMDRLLGEYRERTINTKKAKDL